MLRDRAICRWQPTTPKMNQLRRASFSAEKHGSLLPIRNAKKEKGGRSRPCVSCRDCLLEAVNDPDAHDIDIAVTTGVVAADFLVLLPFGTDAEVLVEVVLRAKAVRDVGVRIGRSRDEGRIAAEIRIRAVHAEFAE